MEDAICKVALGSWAEIHALFCAVVRKWVEVGVIALSYTFIAATYISIRLFFKACSHTSIDPLIGKIQSTTPWLAISCTSIGILPTGTINYTGLS